MPTISTPHFKKPSAYKNINTSAMTKDVKVSGSVESTSNVYEYCTIS